MKIIIKPRPQNGDISYRKNFLLLPLRLSNESGEDSVRWLEHAVIKYRYIVRYDRHTNACCNYRAEQFIDDPETIKKVLK
jgi:hypothetical protein